MGAVLLVIATMLGVAAVPLGLMVTTGRSAASGSFDAAVVFGARVYVDGQPSDALADRVLAAVALHRAGRCPVLIMSGGPGDGDVHETQAMRRLAIDHGVPEQAILLDADGLNTRATAEGSARLAAQHGLRRVVAVTHFYHTPRAGMALRRAGLDADTEPASMRGRVLNRLPYFMLRQSAAWWVYFVRG